jgi:hypothetical protein
MHIALIVVLLIQGILLALNLGGDGLGILIAGAYVLLGAAVAMRPGAAVYTACLIVGVLSALLLVGGGFIAFIGAESGSPGSFNLGALVPYFLLQVFTVLASVLLLMAANASHK